MNASAIATALADRAEDVCRHYLPGGRKQGRFWIAGDIDGTPGRSLYVRLSSPRGRASAWPLFCRHHPLYRDATSHGLDNRAIIGDAP